jgi:hypothetical protein
MVVRTDLHSVAMMGAVMTLAAMTVGTSPARGDNFRVENKVFVGNETTPRSESTTIFHEGVVYDYLEKPAEIIVFDKARKRFVLLDPSRRVRTELSTDEVQALSHNLRTWAGGQDNAFLNWLARPKFDQQVDEKTGELLFESPWLVYRVTVAPAESDEIARQYREFSDWYVQLNTRLNPGYKQTFARMVVNEALAKRGELPREVHLTVKSKVPFQKTTARGQHQVVRRLVQSDRDRVAQTDQFMAIFPPVEFEQYQKKLQP